MTQQNPRLAKLFSLEYPQSVGVFRTYEEAQKVVDNLADKEFPVQNLCIVGTDLKSLERVTGRQTWGTVLLRGVQSGLTTGLMVAILMILFMPGANTMVLFASALLIGVLIGIGMSVLSYWASRGKRDFTSITQTIATSYELLCEHKVAGKAREIIQAMPEIRAAAFSAAPPQLAYQYPAYQYPAQPYPSAYAPPAQQYPPPAQYAPQQYQPPAEPQPPTSDQQPPSDQQQN